MSRFFEVLKNLVFPPRCAGCHALLPPTKTGMDAVFCKECTREWNAELCLQCPTCFAAYPDCRCQPSILARAGSKGLVKLAPYGDTSRERVVRRIVLDMKQKARRRTTALLAKELALSLSVELSKLGWPTEHVVLVHLPRDAKKMRQSGTDQAKALALALSRHMGLTYLPLLHRKKSSKEQKKLTAKEREANLRDAFTTGEAPKECYAVLVDDVVTTGASMSVGVRALRKAGVKEVLCLCVAQTPKRH